MQLTYNGTAYEEVPKLLGIKLGPIVGCGSFGSVFDVEGEPNKVFKVSADNFERQAIELIIQLRESGEEEAAHFAPIYYSFHVVDGSTFAYVREKVKHPIDEDVAKDVGDLNYAALGAISVVYPKRSPDVRQRWSRLVDAFERIQTAHYCALADVTKKNIGQTIEDNQYRKQGELVIFDFQKFDLRRG